MPVPLLYCNCHCVPGAQFIQVLHTFVRLRCNAIHFHFYACLLFRAFVVISWKTSKNVCVRFVNVTKNSAPRRSQCANITEFAKCSRWFHKIGVHRALMRCELKLAHVRCVKVLFILFTASMSQCGISLMISTTRYVHVNRLPLYYWCVCWCIRSVARYSARNGQTII